LIFLHFICSRLSSVEQGRATALLFETRGAQVIAENINPAVNELARSSEQTVPFRAESPVRIKRNKRIKCLAAA
jgi:hypothetical protein